MKQIQIPEQLFMELVKFHLLDMEENLPSIKQGLEAKLDALVMRDLYSKYKTAPTEEEREQPLTPLLTCFSLLLQSSDSGVWKEKRLNSNTQ